MKLTTTTLASGLAALISGTAPAVRAQADSAAPSDLDQRMRILERKLEVQEEDAQSKAATATKPAADGDGFTLKSGDGNYQIKWKGLVQTDARFYQGDDDQKLVNTFLPRRVRPIVEGTAWKYYGFRIMPDFGNGSAALTDAYLDIAYVPGLKVRFGKFTPPVGLERLQSSADLFFVEQGYATLLTPNRDVGAQVSGDLLGERLGYALGAFNGLPDNGNGDLDNNDEKDAVARLFAQPFKGSGVEALEGLGLGVAGSYGKRLGDTAALGSQLAAYASVGQQRFFQPSKYAYANGGQYRIDPQGYWFWGPVGLFGEYVLSSQKSTRAFAPAETTVVHRGSGDLTLRNQAWQAVASFVLTGESPSYKGVKPRHPLLAAENGGLGAIEIVGRVTGITVDSKAFDSVGYIPAKAATATAAAKPASIVREAADPATSAREALTFGAGVNWYQSRVLKLQADYEYTRFRGGAAGGADRKNEQAILARAQVNF